MTTATPRASADLAVHESAGPERIAAGLLNALRAGYLPGAWLYRGEAQARRWLAYHEAWSPSRADAQVQALYRRAFALAARETPLEAVHVVGLGAGGGHKDAGLLTALLERPGYGRPRRRYSAVDASAELALEAAGHVAATHPAVPCHPVVADLEALPHLEPSLARNEMQPHARMLTAFGMIPNLDPLRFPAWLAALLRAQDVLLFSANLSPRGYAADRDRIAAQYDNPPARAWYVGALEALAVPGGAISLEVSTAPLARLAARLGTAEDSAWRIEAVATFRHPTPVRLVAGTVTFPARMPLRIFRSHRFTAAAVEALLSTAGLRPVQSWLHEGGEEGVFVCEAGV